MEVFMGNWSVNWRCCCPSMSIVRYRKQCPQTQTLGGWGWNFHETSWFLGQTRTLWADRRFGVLRTWVEKSCAYHLTHLEAPLEQEVLLPRLMDWFPPPSSSSNWCKLPQSATNVPIISHHFPIQSWNISRFFNHVPGFSRFSMSFSEFFHVSRTAAATPNASSITPSPTRTLRRLRRPRRRPTARRSQRKRSRGAGEPVGLVFFFDILRTGWIKP